jgi:hypothetical protein
MKAAKAANIANIFLDLSKGKERAILPVPVPNLQG